MMLGNGLELKMSDCRACFIVFSSRFGQLARSRDDVLKHGTTNNRLNSIILLRT